MVLLALLAIVVTGAAISGAVRIPLGQLLPLLWSTPADPEAALWRNVLLDVRLPRIVLGVVVGAGLALAGATMQALFRNPLAEPGLVGVSLGGAAGAVAAIVLGADRLAVVASAAFGGSLIATAAAYRLGRRAGGSADILLAGIAINAICASLIGLFTYLADDVQLRNLTFWNLGSLANGSWPVVAGLAPWVALIGWRVLREWRALNALLLGEREAGHLGYDLAALRRRLIVGAALIVGPIVAVTGTITFVGLVVPHLVRIATGADHRLLLPLSLVGGAVAITLGDWIARVVVIPAELPIGIVTALVGGPFLLWLMQRGVGR
ncbi:MAG: FecCD family ABC transporter permease [Lautropia sp.]